MSAKPFRIIGLFEGAYHNEVLEAYVFHFLPLTERLYIFTNTFQRQQAATWRDNAAIQWFLPEKNEKAGVFLQKNQQNLSSCDWLITTSLPEPAGDLAGFRFPCPAWLVVHNINYLFSGPFSNLYIGHDRFRDKVKIARYIFFSTPAKNKEVLVSFSNIIFPTERMRDYFLEHFPDAGFPTPAVIPFCRTTEVQRANFADVFHIVVPGSIRPDVRDYGIFLLVIPELLKKTSKKIRLSFLGKQKEGACEEILRQLSVWQNDRFSFVYYREFIPQHDFEQTMKTADVLVAPLRPVTRYDAKREYFGYTSESGNIADIVKFQLPAVIPDFYPLPESLAEVVFRYDTAAGLAERLLSMIEGGSNEGILPSSEGLKFFDSEAVADSILKQWHNFRSKSDSFAYVR